MAALNQDEKSDQAQQTAHLESMTESVPKENENDFGDDPKREVEEAGVSYTKEEEGEALKKLDWNLIPLYVCLRIFFSVTSCLFFLTPANCFPQPRRTISCVIYRSRQCWQCIHSRHG